MWSKVYLQIIHLKRAHIPKLVQILQVFDRASFSWKPSMTSDVDVLLTFLKFNHYKVMQFKHYLKAERIRAYFDSSTQLFFTIFIDIKKGEFFLQFFFLWFLVKNVLNTSILQRVPPLAISLIVAKHHLKSRIWERLKNHFLKDCFKTFTNSETKIWHQCINQLNIKNVLDHPKAFSSICHDKFYFKNFEGKFYSD